MLLEDGSRACCEMPGQGPWPIDCDFGFHSDDDQGDLAILCSIDIPNKCYCEHHCQGQNLYLRARELISVASTPLNAYSRRDDDHYPTSHRGALSAGTINAGVWFHHHHNSNQPHRWYRHFHDGSTVISYFCEKPEIQCAKVLISITCTIMYHVIRVSILIVRTSTTRSYWRAIIGRVTGLTLCN